MKTWTERLPGIIAFIESGNGIAKAKAKKELEKMAEEADKLILCNKEVRDYREFVARWISIKENEKTRIK